MVRRVLPTKTAKCGLVVIFVLGLLAGQTFAGPFTLDKYEAMLLQQVSVSSGDFGVLFLVTDSPALYGAAMQGEVGYWGMLYNSGASGDSLASMRIGAAGTAALANIQAAGSYTGFQLFVANDNDDPWSMQLYVEAGGTSYASGFTTLIAGTNTTLMLDFGTTVDFSQVTDLGFEVRGDFAGISPSNPDNFHASVQAAPIPAPGAALLAFLGAGIVGLARRGRRAGAP